MGGDVVGDVDAELDSTDVLGEVVLVDSKSVKYPVHPEEYSAAGVLLDHLPQAARELSRVTRPDCASVIDANSVELLGDELEVLGDVVRAVSPLS